MFPSEILKNLKCIKIWNFLSTNMGHMWKIPCVTSSDELQPKLHKITCRVWLPGIYETWRDSTFRLGFCPWDTLHIICSNILMLKFCSSLYMLHACTWGHRTAWENRFSLSTLWVLQTILIHQAWQRAPLPTEPSQSLSKCLEYGLLWNEFQVGWMKNHIKQNPEPEAKLWASATLVRWAMELLDSFHLFTTWHQVNAMRK